MYARQVNNYSDSFSLEDLILGLTPVPWISPALGLWLENPCWLQVSKGRIPTAVVVL